MLDKDQRKRGVADELGFPRVLRHWNLDVNTGTLNAGPELVVYEPEMDHLRATQSLARGVVDPSDVIKRPRKASGA